VSNFEFVSANLQNFALTFLRTAISLSIVLEELGTAYLSVVVVHLVVSPARM